jgi:membrane fusion protein, copper/silver efflux system
MKRTSVIVAFFAGAVCLFLAGLWTGHGSSGGAVAAGSRKVLYWVDPMHPSYKSDKPGIAPDCGMQLEPVYAGGSTGDGKTLPAGAAKVTAERRQMIGVKVGTVEKAGGTRTIRTLGRVAVDETRVYRLNAATDGWIREVSSATAGSLVKKDQTLAAYYAPEFLASQQSFLFALSALDRFETTGSETAGQLQSTNPHALSAKNGVLQARDSLESLGMSERQVEEIQKTRELAHKIYVVPPADAFVLARNVSLGQRFEKGFELYRVADLSHVWILADLFEREGQDIVRGQVAKVTLPYRGKSFTAKVSDIPPQFDPATRTLKVRLETDNPAFALRPEMFVDVEFSVAYLPTLVVPADAVLDSGLRQTVYVETEPDVFEPRKVETGRSFGDSVEIVRGLTPGERIVLSGNFLIDSESRMKAAVAGVRGESSKDPVCGMDVDETKARAEGKTAQHGGVTYFFCSETCKKKFDASPATYAGSTKGGRPGHG